MTKVFVYGTLKKGKGNHHKLATATLVDYNYSLYGYRLFVTNQGLPFIKKKEGSSIIGEVYEVDDSTLKEIRQLEGVEASVYKEVEVDGILLYEAGEHVLRVAENNCRKIESF